MRIAILTSTDLRHNYFCLSLIKSFNVVGIIQEPKGVAKRKILTQERIVRKSSKFDFIFKKVRERLYGSYKVRLSREKKRIETQYFNEAAEEFKRQYTHLIIDIVDRENQFSINDDRYVNKLKKLKLDVTVVMGTGLLKNDILSVAECILNMHTGISPYYRGGKTNFWPLRYKQAQYCGVTIHKIDPGIDTGDIIYHGLPQIDEDDTFPKVNCKSIILGTELMKQALLDLKDGRSSPKKQWERGRLFSDKDYNAYHAYKYYKNIQANYFKDYCQMLIKGKIVFPKGLLLNRNQNLVQYIPEEYK